MTNKNHILSILLGFTTQFTDYFAQRIKKFLKPRYVERGRTVLSVKEFRDKIR